jgi:Na+/H+-translocating membrane pyrophosphatase
VKMKRLLGFFVGLGLLILFCPGCYVLNSQSIPLELKTINVGFFENDAPIVVSYHSQQLTEALKDRIRTTTRLSIVAGEGDAMMTGSITDYHIAPVSIQATNNNVAPIAGASALTITVHVKFVYTPKNPNDPNKKISFEQDFSKSLNFSGDISGQESTLITAIDKQIIDDIFNKAFNNW